MAVITQPPRDDGDQAPGTHVSGQISPSPLPGPGNAQTHDHGNWVY